MIDAATADYIFDGAAPYDYFGIGFSAGDVDGDGLDDLLIGASGNDDVFNGGGTSYLFLAATMTGPGQYSHSSANHKIVGEGVNLAVGAQMTAEADLNGDGMNDLVVGSIYSDYGATNGGLVSVFSACEN